MKQLPSFDNPIGVLGRQQRNPELLLWDVDLLRLDGHQLLNSQTYNELFCWGMMNCSVLGQLYPSPTGIC